MAIVRIDCHVLGVVAAQMLEIEFSQLDRGIGRIDPENLELVVIGDVQASRAGVVGQACRLICEVQEAGRLDKGAVGLQLPQVRGAEERALLNFRVADEEPHSGHIGYPGGIGAAERRHVGARDNCGAERRDGAAGRAVGNGKLRAAGNAHCRIRAAD